MLIRSTFGGLNYKEKLIQSLIWAKVKGDSTLQGMKGIRHCKESIPDKML